MLFQILINVFVLIETVFVIYMDLMKGSKDPRFSQANRSQSYLRSTMCIPKSDAILRSDVCTVSGMKQASIKEQTCKRDPSLTCPTSKIFNT